MPKNMSFGCRGSEIVGLKLSGVLNPILLPAALFNPLRPEICGPNLYCNIGIRNLRPSYSNENGIHSVIFYRVPFSMYGH